MQEYTNLAQVQLINNLNELATEAEVHLGMTAMTRLNEGGCCLALALLNLQKAAEGKEALHGFYEIYDLISTQLTPQIISGIVNRAKITDDQKKVFMSSRLKEPLYNDFTIVFPNGKKLQFEALYQFMQLVGKAQSGYESKISDVRFSGTDITSKGIFETVIGNFENNYVFHCNDDNIAAILRVINIANNNYALVCTGGHAINFRKSEDNHYLVYDSNDRALPLELNTLEEVGQALMKDMKRVNCVTPDGNVILSIQGVSFNDGRKELERAIKAYMETLLHAHPVDGISKECHDVIVNSCYKIDKYGEISSGIYNLYSQKREVGLVSSMQEFVKILPPQLQKVAKESLDYFRRAAFDDSVKEKRGFKYDASSLTAVQIDLMTQLNGYIQQYHEGHLSKADFAENALSLLASVPDLSEFPSKLHLTLQKLRVDMETFMEGEVSVATVINQHPITNLNDHDLKGHDLVSRYFKESPNRVAIQALLESAQANDQQFVYVAGLENISEMDKSGMTRLFQQASVDVIAYVMNAIDVSPFIDDELIRGILSTGNVDVISYLLTHPLHPRYDELNIPERILQFKQPRVANMAIKSKSDPLMSILLDKDYPISDTEAGLILKLADRTPLIELKEKERLDRLQAQEELRADGVIPALFSLDEYEEKFAREHHDSLETVAIWERIVDRIIDSNNENNISQLFNRAIGMNQLDIAKKILLKALNDSPESTDRQKQMLFLAARKGDLEMVKMIIDRNPQFINEKNERRMSLLSTACDANQAEVFEYLMQKRVEIMHDNSSPLVFAARSGNADICRRLSLSGASTSSRSSVNGFIPLSSAMTSRISADNKVEVVEVLYKKSKQKEEMNEKNEQEDEIYEALLEVAKSPETSIKDVEILIEKFGFNLSQVPNLQGKSLALHALEHRNLILAEFFLKKPGIKPEDLEIQGDLLLREVLIKIGDEERIRANPVKQQLFDNSKLEALEKIFIDLVQNKKVSVNGVTQGGITPIMLAAQSRNTMAIKLLIKRGAKINAEDELHNTALHYAANNGVIENITIISEESSAHLIRNHKGFMPIHLLADTTTTFEAITALQGENPLDVTDLEGNTALHLAAKKDKNVDTVRALLTAGLSPLQPNNPPPGGMPKSALDIVMEATIGKLNGAAHTKKTPYFGNLAAVLQVLPARMLDQNRPLLDSLKIGKRDILVAYKAYISRNHARAKTPAEQKAIVVELEQTMRGMNAIGRLYKSKFRYEGGLRYDNTAMKELKELRDGLVKGTYVRPNTPAGPRNR